MHTAGVSCGNWILFAGGADMITAQIFSEVDIWNTVTNQYIMEELNVPRVFLSAVSTGEKVLFAGGTNLFISYDDVDIYDITTGGWLTSTILSEPRCCMGAAVSGDLAFFAGGYDGETSTVTDVVDIYHFSSGTWTTATLSQARGFLSAVAVGNKVLFAGGTKGDNEPSDRIDIYDISTNTWDIASLSVPRAFYDPSGAFVCQNKAYFACGGPMDLYNHQTYANTDAIDIYDAGSDSWSVDNLTHSLILYAVAGVEDHFILAGGWTSTGEFSSTVEIYSTDDPGCWDGVTPQPAPDVSFRVYPNPSGGDIHLELPDNAFQSPVLTNVFNMQGQLVFSQRLVNGDHELSVKLPDGIYLLKVVLDNTTHTEMITIQN
jgi:hypothetical protein